jgi:D-lactate dehydrogenase (cytochrome)
VDDLLTDAENAAIADFGVTYRHSPSIAALAQFLGTRLGVELAADPAIVEGFASDESHLPGEAEAVCRPRTVRDVAALLRTCRAAGVPVTVSAGRSNLTGSATPAGGVILSTTLLATPELRIDAAARTVEAPVGMLLEDLRKAVLAATDGTLCYPVDPTSRAEATVGGSIACNASGFTPGEPGATRHWVESLDVVLPCGGLVRVRRGQTVSRDGIFLLRDHHGVRELPVPRHPRVAIKNAGGPFSAVDGTMDFVDLVVGAEGLIGVVVGAVLRLAERPAAFLDLFVSLPAEAEALKLRQALVERLEGGLAGLSALEYFGVHCRQFMKHEDRFFHGTDPVGVYIQVPLKAGVAPEEAAEPWLELLTDCGVALDPDAILLLDNDRDRAIFLEARHSMPANALEVVQHRGTYTLMTDTVVPPAAFAAFLERTHAALRRNGLEYLAFGHLGDCHLHFTLLPEKAQLEQATRVYEGIVADSAALGGVYSGEHGTGKRKRADFVACHGPLGVAEVRRTKAALDPEFLLNRGNVVTPPH